MLGIEIGIVLVGGALLLLARVQRVTSRRVQRMMLHDALTAPDPAARRAAIQVVGDGGLTRFAGLFLGFIKWETDPTVLVVLAQVVVRNQWEPASDPAMVRLRLWAHRYLESTSEPSWRRTTTSSSNGRYQGPTVGDVVNLLLQPVDKGTARRRRLSRLPQRWQERVRPRW